MRGLKALVIIMAVLIVVGFAVVVVTLVNRSASRDGGPPPRAQASQATLATATPYQTKITIPAGARIVETAAADGRLTLRLKLAGGAARILVIDLATGRRVGAIDLPQARP